MEISRADVALWVDERVVFVDYFATRVEHDHGDLDDSVVVEESGRLDIHDGDSFNTTK
jgi:RNA-binding protein YlmH